MENSKNILSDTKKLNDINKSGNSDENDRSNSGEKKIIPLAAKDSEWVDTIYHKPKRRVKPPENKEEEDDDVEEEEEEMFLVNPPDEIDTENLPIYALFPSLRVHYPQSSSFLNRQISTTDIAKSLVGEKPNFSVLKTSAKLLPSKIVLESIQELPVDSTDEDENIEENKVFTESASKEIGDANNKDIEIQCSVLSSSKTEIVQNTFPRAYPSDNQTKGLWYESNSANNFRHTTERIKKNITKTGNNPEM